MNINQILKRVDERFDEKFYEGESNSVFCKAHKLYATPLEIKQFIHTEIKQAVLDVLPEEAEWIDSPNEGYKDIPARAYVHCCNNFRQEILNKLKE